VRQRQRKGDSESSVEARQFSAELNLRNIKCNKVGVVLRPPTPKQIFSTKTIAN
jgi:hypothetical protein